MLDRGGAAHHAAGAVAGRAERLLHAARLADQHPTGPAHVAGDDHRLADLRDRRRALRDGPAETPASPPCDAPTRACVPAVDVVLFELGDVVGHVVDQVHAAALARCGRRPSRTPRGPATSAVAGCTRRSWPPRASRRDTAAPRGCRPARRPAAGRAGRCRISAGALRSIAQGVVAHLVAQPARAGVDHHADHVLGQPHRARPPRRRRSASTTCTSRKWLPEPSVPHWSQPRSRARSLTRSGSAPSRRPRASVCSMSPSVARPRRDQIARALAPSAAAARSWSKRYLPPRPTPVGTLAKQLVDQLRSAAAATSSACRLERTSRTPQLMS